MHEKLWRYTCIRSKQICWYPGSWWDLVISRYDTCTDSLKSWQFHSTCTVPSVPYNHVKHKYTFNFNRTSSLLLWHSKEKTSSTNHPPDEYVGLQPSHFPCHCPQPVPCLCHRTGQYTGTLHHQMTPQGSCREDDHQRSPRSGGHPFEPRMHSGYRGPRGESRMWQG